MAATTGSQATSAYAIPLATATPISYQNDFPQLGVVSPPGAGVVPSAAPMMIGPGREELAARRLRALQQLPQLAPATMALDERPANTTSGTSK